ncbi:hypothetical protein Peur_004359 [Populus x canadensis]
MQLLNTNHKLRLHCRLSSLEKHYNYPSRMLKLLDSSQFSKLYTTLTVENVLETTFERFAHYNCFQLSRVNHQ